MIIKKNNVIRSFIDLISVKLFVLLPTIVLGLVVNRNFVNLRLKRLFKNCKFVVSISGCSSQEL